MSDQRVVAIVQARMGSKRLPGKVLLEIQDEPMLIWVVERARLAQSVDDVIVATTNEIEDDAIVELCREHGIDVVRGNALDVLDRYWQAAQEHEADIIVRLTADCPLIDPDLIDRTVQALLEAEPPADFSANRLPWERTYPIGLDVEVCTVEALKSAWSEAAQAHEREHVMPYLYENPERFRIVHVKAEEEYGHLRWTVDTGQDLEFICEIAELLPDRNEFRWRDVLEVVQKNPDLAEINADVQHKTHRDVG